MKISYEYAHTIGRLLSRKPGKQLIVEKRENRSVSETYILSILNAIDMYRFQDHQI